MGLAPNLIGQRVYIDTNIVIFAVERKPGFYPDVNELFLANARGDVSLLTSELSLAEVLVRPIALGDHQTAAVYRSFLRSRPGFKVVPVARGILEASASVRAAIGGRLPDAMHVATALDGQCSHFVSEDIRLKLPTSLLAVRVNQLTSGGP